ncbi:MAG: efflux RND transporter periplasmic adaptor subunit [Desulfobacca sp.]|uniref:efflux RND transporter periplasmic adaptor subunit n=1 Tax=Desulfobacca sp. TaxID=2067990 RepID=UPI0040491BDC
MSKISGADGRTTGVVLLLAGLLALAGCGEMPTFTPPPPPQVTVGRPVRQPVTAYMEFTGNAQAINTVQLRARVAGYLKRVSFKDGDLVKKGQLLFLIEPDPYQARLAEAEAEILRQKAALDYARIEVKRFQRLVAQKAGAQSDLDNWRFQLESAQAALKAAQARRDLAKLDLEYTRVTAPFDGRIDRRLKDPGNLVGAGDNTLLAEIMQIDPIYFYFTINEADLLQLMVAGEKSPLETGQVKVPLFLGLANEEGFPHQGHLDFAGTGVNPTTGTLQLRGIFPNPDGKILPGMFGRVRGSVTGKTSEQLLVPRTALGYDQLGYYVLVVGENNIVQRRAVKPGTEVGDRQVIESGLHGDELIITTGLIKAFPGRPVTPVPATASQEGEKRE